MKKLIIFDAYGTLISSGNSSIESCKKILSLQEKEIDPYEFYGKWKKLHRKHIDESNDNTFLCEWDIFTKDLKCLYELYKINRPYKEDIKYMFETQFNRKVFDDVLQTINILKEKYRIVIGSTTDTYPLLKNMKDNNLGVDNVYTSEIIKKYKPHIDFYNYIIKKESVNIDEVIFVGDSLLDDIYGPKQLNITTVLIDRNNMYNDKNIKPDYIINSLKELIYLDL